MNVKCCTKDQLWLKCMAQCSSCSSRIYSTAQLFRSCKVLGDCLICLLGAASPDCLSNIMSFTDIHGVPLHKLSISLSSYLLHSDIICYKGLTITGDVYVTDHMWWHSADEFKVLLFITMTQNHSPSRILGVRPELNFLHEHTSHIPWFSKMILIT
jgi:hypothetical protein